MNLCKFVFFMLFCFIFQTDANICKIDGCQQNSPSEILEGNLTSTTNLPDCTMARNYAGLSLFVVLENNNYQECTWIFANTFLDSNRNCVDYNRNNGDGGTPFNQENFFTNFAPCVNRSSSRPDVREITCVMNNGNIYSSIIFRSIANDYFISVECDGKYTKSFHTRVRPCDTTFGQQENKVFVDSNSTDYDAAGSFQCSNNGTLFYSNGTLLQDGSTRCLATAKWKDQENLQCWKAPRVRLEGNYNWVNESKLILQCLYEDSFPKGSNSIFYINKTVSALLKKGETFNLTVNRTFNNVSVSCQAQTPFTEIYNKTGRSKENKPNVLFAPHPQKVKCVLNHTDKICKFKFHSNPNATFVSLNYEGIDLTNSSDILIIGENHSHTFCWNITERTVNINGTYNLTVYSMFQPYFHHILFTITNDSQSISTTTTTAAATTTTTTTTTATTTTTHTFLIEIGVAVPLAVLVLIAIVFIIIKRKKQEKNISDYTKQSCEKEVVMNELYLSADMIQNKNDQKTQSSKKVNTEIQKKTQKKDVNKKSPKNPEDKKAQAGNEKNNEVVYGVVNKPKKKSQTLDESSEKEEITNELYASTDMLDNKDRKPSTDEPQKSNNKIDVEVTYGVVNKAKKKSQNSDNKPESSTIPKTEKKEKAQKKTDNKKKSNNPEETKPSSEESQQTANNKDNEVAYGVVNKPKKKQKASAKSNEKEEKINELYASSDMLENKVNEKPESSTKPATEKKKRAQKKVANKKKAIKTEVSGSKPSSEKPKQTENMKDNEVTYGVVNKPKKKPKASANKEMSTDSAGGNMNDLYQTVDFTKKK